MAKFVFHVTSKKIKFSKELCHAFIDCHFSDTPLEISSDGQIVYCKRYVRRVGRVALVRAYRIDGGSDSADTFHVECIGIGGGKVELPRRFFKNATESEISAMIAWIANVFGAAAQNDLQVFRPCGYTRKRSPAQGGHGPKPTR